MRQVSAPLGILVMLAGCSVKGPPEGGGHWWEGTGVGSVGAGATSSGAGGEDFTPASSEGGAGSGSSGDPGDGGEPPAPPPPSPGVCDPDPSDPPCVECLKDACCDVLELCEGDSACECWKDCLQQDDLSTCYAQCGLPSNVDALLGCIESDCLTSCW